MNSAGIPPTPRSPHVSGRRGIYDSNAAAAASSSQQSQASRVHHATTSHSSFVANNALSPSQMSGNAKRNLLPPAHHSPRAKGIPFRSGSPSGQTTSHALRHAGRSNSTERSRSDCSSLTQRRRHSVTIAALPTPILHLPSDSWGIFFKAAQKYAKQFFDEGSKFLIELKSLMESQADLSLELLESFIGETPYLREIEKAVAPIFEKIRDDSRRSSEFESMMNKFPKSEVHCHLSGSMTPKDLVSILVKYNYYYDPVKKEFHKEYQPGFLRSNEIRKEAAKDIEMALSMRERVENVSMQDIFFEICRRNETMTNLLPLKEMLIPHLQGAIVQNIVHTETMVDFKRITPLNYPENYLQKFVRPLEELHTGSASPACAGMRVSTHHSLNSSPLQQPLEAPLSLDLVEDLLPTSHFPQNNGSSGSSHSSLSSSPGSSGSSYLQSASPPLLDHQEIANWKEALKILQDSGWIANYVDEWTRTLKVINAETHVMLDQSLRANQSKPDFNYLVEIMRDSDVDKEHEFFAILAAAMALIEAGRDPEKFVNIVGLNLVGPEHSMTSRVNFPKQMKMLKFLKTIYKHVKISLHAGEFCGRSSVGSFERAHHLDESVNIADRIGHATALARAEYAQDQLVERDIPVEVCLTSNEKTMNIKFDEHPVGWIMDLGVSVIVGSDDPGIFITTLTDEFIRIVKEHKWSYSVYKNVVRNALHYAFFEDNESIFEKSKVDNRLHLRPYFWGIQKENWEPCEFAKKILKSSKRARLQKEMEKKIATIEEYINKNYAKFLEV